MKSLRTSAATYAALGCGVVPLHWIREDGSCSCGWRDCTKPGKHPLTEHGASEPITDPETATMQWDELPNANIGLVAGTSQWLVLDLDGEAARERFASIADQATMDAVKSAPTQKTGKGWHIIFKDDTGAFSPSTGKDEDKGIDIRAGVSYIVAEPSRHASGATYRWIQHRPPFEAEAPTLWLRSYLEERASRKAATIIDEDVEVGEGSRNAVLTELGGTMRRRGFNEDEIRAALIAANLRINKPPLSDREVGSIARSLATYQPSDLPRDITIASMDTDDLLSRLQHLDTATLVNDAPPIIEWVWDDYMAPGTLNMLHGDGGLGKSYLSLKIAEQMSRPEGGELFGKKIHPGGVVILDGENAAVQIHHRIHNTTITADANLHVFTVDQPILGYEDKTNAIFQHIADTYDPRLVIIDSQRALWAGDEKEQMEVGRMLRAFAKGLEAFPYATLLLHHDNRGKDYAGSSDMNAAISGARLHLEKHGGKDETQARRLSMPKNRIGPEMLPQEFFLSIETQPRSHRYQVSGIGIRAYESSTETMARELLEQAKMKIINQSCTNDELFAAFGWEVENYRPRKNEHREMWDMIAVDLEHAGFARKREPGGGNRMLWKYIGEPTHSV
jgi:hypothetical protein